jgi:hypothetical protein
MPFLTFLLIYVATFLITELLRPKPNIENAKPAGIGDFQVPTATEGRVIPIIWGRVKVAGPNVIWYGDLVADPIKEKIKTGLFSKTTQTVGFNYFIGLQFGLCRGQVDLLYAIRNDESFCWGPEASTADTPVVPIDAGAAYTINQPAFFGGEDAGGGGGLVGGGRIYPGSETQAVNAYIAQFQVPAPAYRGTCYLTMERINVGFTAQLRAFEFELERFPDGLDLATVQPGDERIGDTANPMNVVFEVLNDAEWGVNISASIIDVAAMRAVAATLATEGNGFAWNWDSTRDVLEVIRLVEQQVDGVLFQDPVSGFYSFKLIRFDYTPGTLELLDESNVKRMIRYSRPAWSETQNQITAEFNDPRKNYTQSFALAQDMGNIDIVQEINFSKVRFPGCKDATLANALAWREIRQLSFPVATGQLEVDRSQYDIVPGDVRELSWSRMGIVRLPIRITKVNRGKILDNIIRLDWTQDVFSFNAGSFADPPDTGWVPPPDAAQAPLAERLLEVPYRLTFFEAANVTDLQIGTVVVRDGSLHIGYNTFATVADLPGTAPAPTATDVIPPGGSSGMAPYGLLTAALDRGQTNGFQDTVGFTIDNLVDTNFLEDATAGELEAAKNVMIIDNEVILFETVVDNLNGTFTISDLVRGALDTIPAAHADNAEVFFISYGLGLVNADPNPDGTQNYQVKNQMFTPFDTFDFGSISALGVSTDNRANKGYPARDIQATAAYFPATLSDPFTMTWQGSDKFTQAFATAWDDILGIAEEAGVTFRIRIIEDPGGLNTVKLDLTGLTVNGSGVGSQAVTGWSAGEITNSYQYEVSAQHANGDSQVWIMPFTRV